MALRVHSASNKMSNSGIFWGGRQPIRRADKLANFLRPLSRNSGKLDLLEPYETVQVNQGKALDVKNKVS